MLLAKLFVTAFLTLDASPRFHLLDADLALIPTTSAAPSGRRCALFPDASKLALAPMHIPTPDAAIRRSLGDAFGGRTQVSGCVYSVQGVRRQDPRFGMRQVTLEVVPPLVHTPLKLMLRTVVGRNSSFHDYRHNRAEIYAGVGL